MSKPLRIEPGEPLPDRCLRCGEPDIFAPVVFGLPAVSLLRTRTIRSSGWLMWVDAKTRELVVDKPDRAFVKALEKLRKQHRT